MQTLIFSSYSLISGVGELDIHKDTPKKPDTNDTKDGPYPDCPFLLLDVRDRDAYDQCHIVGGKGEMTSMGFPWGTFIIVHLVANYVQILALLNFCL